MIAGGWVVAVAAALCGYGCRCGRSGGGFGFGCGWSVRQAQHRVAKRIGAPNQRRGRADCNCAHTRAFEPRMHAHRNHAVYRPLYSQGGAALCSRILETSGAMFRAAPGAPLSRKQVGDRTDVLMGGGLVGDGGGGGGGCGVGVGVVGVVRRAGR